MTRLTVGKSLARSVSAALRIPYAQALLLVAGYEKSSGSPVELGPAYKDALNAIVDTVHCQVAPAAFDRPPHQDPGEVRILAVLGDIFSRLNANVRQEIPELGSYTQDDLLNIEWFGGLEILDVLTLLCIHIEYDDEEEVLVRPYKGFEVTQPPLYSDDGSSPYDAMVQVSSPMWAEPVEVRLRREQALSQSASHQPDLETAWRKDLKAIRDLVRGNPEFPWIPTEEVPFPNSGQ